jgi:apolipoprotein N-acyltransferase
MTSFDTRKRSAVALAWRLAACVGGGLLLAAAYPPGRSPGAAWVALVPFLFLARFSAPVRSFRWGFLGGLVFWLTSISWLLRLARTGGPPVLVALGWLLLSAYCALYIGAFCMLASALWSDAREADAAPRNAPAPAGFAPGAVRNVGLMILLPALWVGCEYLRSTLFGGFAWNALGVSQYRNLAVIQVAAWGGVYAVSAVVAMLNIGLALTAFRLVNEFHGGRRARLHVELMAGMMVAVAFWFHGATTVRQLQQESAGFPAVRIAAIQPNVVQTEKWTEDTADGIYDAIATQMELVQSLGHLDLVIWPETALPGLLPADAQGVEFIRQMASRTDALLVGAMVEEKVADDAPSRLYNASLLLSRDGRTLGEYRKRHLVPFGEYVPLESVIPALGRLAPLGFSCTAGTTGTVFRLPSSSVPFSALICFEDSVAWLARDAVRNGARFLVNQTNDAWFDGSAAAVQHMSHCVFRCVENRVPAVRAANTGVSCFIARTGRIEGLESLEREGWKLGVAGFSAAPLLVNPGAGRSFYTRHGDLPFALPCGVAAALGIVLTFVRHRHRSGDGCGSAGNPGHERGQPESAGAEHDR